MAQAGELFSVAALVGIRSESVVSVLETRTVFQLAATVVMFASLFVPRYNAFPRCRLPWSPAKNTFVLLAFQATVAAVGMMIWGG